LRQTAEATVTTGEELRAARRAANLTLAEVARHGAVSAGHLSRVESGERQVTPATVVLYQRVISAAMSPTVEPVRRRNLFGLAVVSAAAGLSTPQPIDLDECAQWLAWQAWRSGVDALAESDLPRDRVDAVAELVARRYLVRSSDGTLRFPHPPMMDFYLARGIFDGIAAGSSARLEAAQTTHATDLVIAQFARDNSAEAQLTRWMTTATSPVLRVNAAGVLAKIGTARATDDVVSALRVDTAARALYLTAVASRVLTMPWTDAAAFATGAATISDDAAEALAAELRNPRDAAARWCAAVLIYQMRAASRATVREAVADALRAESAAENLRTMAALAAGVDPANP
jgi:transcriptional regulator with XRE-family HTH domain